MLMFDRNTYQPIARIMQDIINSPILWDEQEARGVAPEVWTTDEWTIETGKAILSGEEDYLKDPMPVRRYDSMKEMFSKQSILNFAQKKYNMLEILKMIKNEADTLLICEVGSGLDLGLAESIKTWKKIIAYDYNDKIVQRTKRFFHNPRFEFTQCNSSFYKLDAVVEPTIVICDNMHIPYEEFLVKINDNVKHIIWDGELKK